jgi:hypothetical protein
MGPGHYGFFGITEYSGLTAEDFKPKDDVGDENEEAAYDYEMETLTGFSYPLQSGKSYPIHFRLLDGTTRKPIAIDGRVRLALRDSDGVEVPFPYTLSPSHLEISGGVVNGAVHLTTSGQLERIWLDVVEVIPAGQSQNE